MKVDDVRASGRAVNTGRGSSATFPAWRWTVIPWPAAERFYYFAKMEIGEVFYPRSRPEWRSWLEENGSSATEVWVRRFRKASGVQSIGYDDLVEECLCFGWIDGVMKKYDDESNVQRITPGKQKSFLSELNRQRVWKLEAMGLMTGAGRENVRGNTHTRGGRPRPTAVSSEMKETQRRTQF